MKFILVLISISFQVFAQTNLNCAAYTCPTTSMESAAKILRSLDTSTPCLTFYGYSNGIPYYNATSCPSTAPYCTKSYNVDAYYCNSAANAFNISYPGEVCATTANCIAGGTCTSAGICQGKQSGSCSSDDNCDVLYFCSPATSTCVPVISAGNHCDVLNVCDSHLYCDPTNNTCRLKGSLPILSTTPTRWACSSFYAYTDSTGNKACWKQPNITDINNNSLMMVNCTIGTNCNYTIPTSGGNGLLTTYKSCTCGYTSTGGNQGFCPPPQGFPQLSQNLTNLLNFTSNSPKCHVSTPLVCFSKNITQNSLFNSSWIAANLMWDGPLYFFNPTCVQGGLNQIFYAMINANYVPPQNNTPVAGALGYSAIAIMGLTFLML